MLEIKDVTVVAIDLIHPLKTLRAIELTMSRVKFGYVILLSDEFKIVKDIEADDLRNDLQDKYDNFRVIHYAGELTNKIHYSRFLVNEIGDYFTTSHCLHMQWHGFVVNPEAWSDDFLKYDYIGARWHFHQPPHNVGNGGFSLRSKKYCNVGKDFYLETRAATKIANPSHWQRRLRNYHPEDHICCISRRDYFDDSGIKFAPEDVAMKFSVENEKYTGSFGFHELDKTEPELFDKFYNGGLSWKEVLEAK